MVAVEHDVARPPDGRRGAVEDLPSRRPLGPSLPALYQEDGFTMRFVSGFDQAFAPVLCALDNLASYFDPALAPPDFVDWLAGWVAAAVDENWPIERRRALVARAVELYRWRGTARALAEQVELFSGVRAEIEESGAIVASTTPRTPLPGQPQPCLTVRLVVPDPSQVDERRLNAVVSAAKPAHVLATVEVSGEVTTKEP